MKLSWSSVSVVWNPIIWVWLELKKNRSTRCVTVLSAALHYWPVILSFAPPRLAIALPLLSQAKTPVIVSWTLQYNDVNEVTLHLSVLLFQVKAQPSGMHFSLKNSLPVTIGTIPLWQSPVLQQPLPFGAPQQFVSAPSAPPPDTGTNFAPSLPYPDIRKFHQLIVYVPTYYEQTLVLRERNIYFISVSGMFWWCCRQLTLCSIMWWS